MDDSPRHRHRSGSLGHFNTPPKISDLFVGEEAFFTPGPTPHARRSLPNSRNISRMGSFNGIGDSRPPSRDFAPTVEIVEGNREVDEWFRNLIFRRKLLAAFWSTVSFALIYLSCLLFLQFSLWIPITSISNIVSSAVSPNLWILLLAVSVLFFCVAYAVISILTTADQSKPGRIYKKENWICHFLLQFFNLLSFAIALGWFFDHSLLYHHGVFYTIFFLGTIVPAAKTAFVYDFSLVFSSSTNHKKFTSLEDLLSFQSYAFLETAVIDAVKVGTITGVAAVGYYFIMVDFSSLWFSVNLSAHSALLCVFSSQFLLGRLLNRLCLQIVMDAIVFDFPPAYAVAHPTAEQQRNIIAALYSNDPLLKLFAVFDVRKLCRIDAKVRRAAVFALTQPAGHPKNWTSLRSACLAIVAEMRDRVEERCSQMKGEERKEEQEELHRDALMMPPKARKRLGSLQKPFREPRSLPSSPLDSIRKFIGLFPSASLVSSYDVDLLSYAVDGLAQLAVHSASEDLYGVVQKDLPAIVRGLVQLYASIDKYFREKAFMTNQASNDKGLCQIMDSASCAVTRLSKKFSPHLGSFNLSNPDLGVYESIVGRPF